MPDAGLVGVDLESAALDNLLRRPLRFSGQHPDGLHGGDHPVMVDGDMLLVRQAVLAYFRPQIRDSIVGKIRG